MSSQCPRIELVVSTAGHPPRLGCRRGGGAVARHYVHHVPGRLRVRSPALACAKRFEAARALLSAVPGVLETRPGRAVGSLLVRFDPARVGADALLARLHAQGHVDVGGAIGPREVLRALADTRTARVARLVLELLTA